MNDRCGTPLPIGIFHFLIWQLAKNVKVRATFSAHKEQKNATFFCKELKGNE
jgi:hypothetical protein